MELDTIYRLIAMRENGPTVKPYMECLRDKLIEIAEDVADLAVSGMRKLNEPLMLRTQ